MKTLTEFTGITLKQAAKTKAELITAGKTPEELPAALGEALKVEGDKLTLLLGAIETVETRLNELKRVVVLTIAEGEKAPSGAVEKNGQYWVVEHYPSAEKQGGGERGRDERGGRGGRDGGKRGGRAGAGAGGRGDSRPGGGRGPGGPGGDNRGPRGPGGSGGEGRGPRGPMAGAGPRPGTGIVPRVSTGIVPRPKPETAPATQAAGEVPSASAPSGGDSSPSSASES